MANNVAYGFTTLQDVMAQRLNENNNIERVQTAVLDSVAEYQRQLNEMMSILVRRTTKPSIRYDMAGGGTLQPLDQHGNPLPVVPGATYVVSFPIQGAGTAWGNNRVSRAKMTVEDANANTLDVQYKDMDWMARHMLAAIFTNTTWTYPDEEFEDLTIQPLAITSDGVTYVRRGGSATTDQHYLAQANAISNTDNPYPAIYTELFEHPSNRGPFVAYIPTNQVATTVALSTFVEMAVDDIQPGDDQDRIVGSLSQGFGDQVLGKVGNLWIVEWGRLPDNYIIAVAQGGDPVLGMREHPEAELQGLQPEFQDVDGNRYLYKFIRFAGFGVMNRVGAVVQRIGNGTYAIPTGYTAPLPV